MRPLRTITVFVPLAIAAIAPQASAAASTKCRGSFQTLGSYKYTDSNLTVTNTTCAAGKKLAQKVPPYRVLKPRHVSGYLCTAVMHYSGPLKSGGGYQAYTCSKGAVNVKWHVLIASEL